MMVLICFNYSQLCPLTLNEPFMFTRCTNVILFIARNGGPLGTERMTNIERVTVDSLRRLISLTIIINFCLNNNYF